MCPGQLLCATATSQFLPRKWQWVRYGTGWLAAAAGVLCHSGWVLSVLLSVAKRSSAAVAAARLYHNSGCSIACVVEVNVCSHL